MKKYLAAISFVLFLVLQIAHAAVPRIPTCPEIKSVFNVEELTQVPATNLMWQCLDLSFLTKSDLMTVSKIAPQMKLQLSRVNLGRSDFDELQKVVPVELTVDSKKLARTDLVELLKLGTKLTIYSDLIGFNTIDYSELADAGTFTLHIRGPQFNLRELNELAANKKIALVLEGKHPYLTEQNLEALVKINQDLQFIP